MILTAEASRFRDWSRATRQRSGDWWACYPHKVDYYAAVRLTVHTEAVTPLIADHLLEILVLDAQFGQVLDILETNPTCSYQLAVHGKAHRDSEVRAQLALLLGRIGGLGAIDNLRELAFDQDEHVRANAVASLQNIDPGIASMVLQQYIETTNNDV